MKTYTGENIFQWVGQFNTRTLPKEAWTHEAHLVVALWHNWHFDFETAFERVRSKIIAYNEAVGTPNTDTSGYHETLTRFWMIFTRNFMVENPSKMLDEVCNIFLASAYAAKDAALAYYTRERLFSVTARKEWMEGDLQEVDFSNMDKKGFPMNDHKEFTDREFEQAFESCTFPAPLFNHEAHLRLAWIHLHKYGEKQAIDHVCTQIRNYAGSLGAHDKYNVTLTIAAVKAVKHFMDKAQSATFLALIAEFPRLKFNFRDLMAAHYGVDIYNSPKAKQEFLEPDLLPFE